VASGKNDRIESVGIVVNPHISAAEALAEEIAGVVETHDARVWKSEGLDEEQAPQWVAESDLVVTLGGDGTILRAASVAVDHGTLLLGINLGRIGFLTEAEPGDWEEILPQVLRGDYWVEERMTLDARADRGDELLGRGCALNDAVVGQGAISRVVRLEVYVDGDMLTSYVTDALIVATPTGSTAYALAAGGPIMPPEQRNILLVPVAPHLSLDRPVVLAEGVCVKIVVEGHSPAALTLDGQRKVELTRGDTVRVEAGCRPARFARVRERDYFYRTLMARLVPRRRDLTRS
jgi:NAD+ kinase